MNAGFRNVGLLCYGGDTLKIRQRLRLKYMAYYAIWQILYAFVNRLILFFRQKIRLNLVWCTLYLLWSYFFVLMDIPWMYNRIRLNKKFQTLNLYCLTTISKQFLLYFMVVIRLLYLKKIHLIMFKVLPLSDLAYDFHTIKHTLYQ